MILVDFRGFDTLGELSVLGVGGDRDGGPRPCRSAARQRVPLTVPTTVAARAAAGDRSTCRCDVVFPAVMVGSIYLLFAGHNQPGGGFVGGILAGAAVALRYVSGGIESVRNCRGRTRGPCSARALLRLGRHAITPLLFGDPVMSNAYVSIDPPLLGDGEAHVGNGVRPRCLPRRARLALMMFESFGTTEDDVSVVMAFTAAALFGIGTYLVLQRKLSRVIVGIGLLGHGANMLLVALRPAGTFTARRARATPPTFADPLPQALVLTAIVITFGVTALLLALAYRSWLLTHDDEIADDEEDLVVARHSGHVDTELVDAEVGDDETTSGSAREHAARRTDRAAAARRGGLGARRSLTARPAGRRPWPCSAPCNVAADRAAGPRRRRRTGVASVAGDWFAPVGITSSPTACRRSCSSWPRRCCSSCSSTPSASRAPSATTSGSSRCTSCSPPASRRRSSPATCSTCSWPSR